MPGPKCARARGRGRRTRDGVHLVRNYRLGGGSSGIEAVECGDVEVAEKGGSVEVFSECDIERDGHV